MGELAQRLGQPAVVGEIFAGILLGPTLLGSIPFINEHVIPSISEQSYLDIISLIGAMFLLFIAGMETDIKLIKHHSKNAMLIAFSSLFLAFIAIFTFSLTIPEKLLVDPNQKPIFAFFMATAISVSAISVIAKVLIDLDLIRRDFGQLSVAVGMIDETVVWILLSVIIGLTSDAASGVSSIVISFFKVILFIIVGYLAGKFLVNKMISFIQNKLKLRDKFLTLVVISIFAYGALAQLIGLEAVLGAFVVGIIFGQIPYLSDETIEKLESITFAIFAPIFFAAAGLKVNVQEFTDPAILYLSVGLIFVSFFGKALGAYIGSRYFAKSDHWTALSFGIGLNTRGTIQIVIATIGLTIGIITQDIFSIIIVISVFTSLISPILMKMVLKKVQPKQEEIERIKHEETYAKSILSRINRVLIPVRLRKNAVQESVKRLETNIIERLGLKKDLSITFLTIVQSSEKVEAEKFLEVLKKDSENISVTNKVVVSNNPQEAILKESKKDYDLLIVGATEKPRSSESVFNSFIDNIVRLSTCPSLIVHGHNASSDWKPKRILVPTDGSVASRKAAELAFSLAKDEDDEVHILRVIEEKRIYDEFDTWDNLLDRQFSYAQEIVNRIKEIGDVFSVNTFTKVEIGESPEKVILSVAKENKFDLVVLGTDIRPGSDRLYLGPRVEKIINDCVCPVIVVNSL